jgi:(1->4)-alpha-D-glucan 1-alpha-D-glucosylmutase
MLRDFADGRAKLWTTTRALCFRREHPELFAAGSEYVPLLAEDHAAGNHAREHVIGFARKRDEQIAITLAPRFAYTLMKGEMRAPVREAWGEASIPLPPGNAQEFRNIMTGETVRAHQGTLLCREAFRSFPVALLASL